LLMLTFSVMTQVRKDGKGCVKINVKCSVDFCVSKQHASEMLMQEFKFYGCCMPFVMYFGDHIDSICHK
jgi:hypothetical protein